MDTSSKKKHLYVVADLLAVAILRKIARENRKYCAEELDFSAEGSVCVGEKKTPRESMQ
ncbi:MAG: hypothetical protein PHX43_01450 [Alphaproteobacteria bacterium]|nr:hypothetical protein [Alphaproteobacteria bacterium]